MQSKDIMFERRCHDVSMHRKRAYEDLVESVTFSRLRLERMRSKAKRAPDQSDDRRIDLTYPRGSYISKSDMPQALAQIEAFEKDWCDQLHKGQMIVTESDDFDHYRSLSAAQLYDAIQARLEQAAVFLAGASDDVWPDSDWLNKHYHDCGCKKSRALDYCFHHGCYVYVAEAVGHPTLKIGVSIDPQKRLKAAQTYSPFDVKLTIVARGSTLLEAALHKEFKSFRIRGEWFDVACLDSVKKILRVNYLDIPAERDRILGAKK